MFSVKIFGRKPSSLVRQKHGGFNSTFPMNYHTVIQQAAIQLAFNQAIVKRAEAIKRAGGVELPLESNVISFAERSNSLRRENRLSRPTRRE